MLTNTNNHTQDGFYDINYDDPNHFLSSKSYKTLGINTGQFYIDPEYKTQEESYFNTIAKDMQKIKPVMMNRSYQGEDVVPFHQNSEWNMKSSPLTIDLIRYDVSDSIEDPKMNDLPQYGGFDMTDTPNWSQMTPDDRAFHLKIDARDLNMEAKLIDYQANANDLKAQEERHSHGFFNRTRVRGNDVSNALLHQVVSDRNHSHAEDGTRGDSYIENQTSAPDELVDELHADQAQISKVAKTHPEISTISKQISQIKDPELASGKAALTLEHFSHDATPNQTEANSKELSDLGAFDSKISNMINKLSVRDGLTGAVDQYASHNINSFANDIDHGASEADIQQSVLKDGEANVISSLPGENFLDTQIAGNGFMSEHLDQTNLQNDGVNSKLIEAGLKHESGSQIESIQDKQDQQDINSLTSDIVADKVEADALTNPAHRLSDENFLADKLEDDHKTSLWQQVNQGEISVQQTGAIVNHDPNLNKPTNFKIDATLSQVAKKTISDVTRFNTLESPDLYGENDVYMEGQFKTKDDPIVGLEEQGTLSRAGLQNEIQMHEMLDHNITNISDDYVSRKQLNSEATNSRHQSNMVIHRADDHHQIHDESMHHHFE